MSSASVQRVGGADAGRAIVAAIRQYNDDVKEAIRKEVEAAARDMQRGIESGSPAKTGKYKAGWKVTKRDMSNITIRIVHNAKVPGLPHLLEHGHANWGGGTTPARPHIRSVAEPRVERMIENIKGIIRRGG